MIQKLVDHIIKPQRSEYKISELGPSEFLLDQRFECKRVDFEVVSKQNYKIQCSVFHREIQEGREYPAIMYCHCNRGNRTECEDIIPDLLRMNIVAITFDFCGCGLSEGRYISLGYYEKDQIENVLSHIKQKFRFIDRNRIGIWGRSMGAVSSLLFATSSPEISFLIHDSPFQDLSQVLKEYIDKYKIVSKLAGKYIFKNIKKKILEQANFDLDQVSPIKAITQCKIPILFIHGSDDTIVPIEHSRNLYNIYQGEKIFVEVDVGHNDIRPNKTMDIIVKFIIDKFTPNDPTETEITVLPELIISTFRRGSENICDEEGEGQGISEIKSSEIMVKLDCAKKSFAEDSLSPRFGAYRQPFNRKTKKPDLCVVQENKKQFSRDQQRSQSYYKIKSFDVDDLSQVVLKKNYSTKKETGFLQNPQFIHLEHEKKNTLLLNTSRAVLSVSKGDLEHLETLVILIEEITENELNLVDHLEIGDKQDANQENILNPHGPRRSKSGIRSGSQDEDLLDSPPPPKNSVLENFIDSAARSNFELFRVKKLMPSIYKFSSETTIEKNKL